MCESRATGSMPTPPVHSCILPIASPATQLTLARLKEASNVLVQNGKDEQQPDKQGDTKKPAAAAAKRKSTDGGTKKAAAVNGKAAGAKQQQAVKQESQQESKPAAAAAKKAPAGKADKAAAGGAAAKQTRVKKEFDLPGQTRETPDEVRAAWGLQGTAKDQGVRVCVSSTCNRLLLQLCICAWCSACTCVASLWLSTPV